MEKEQLIGKINSFLAEEFEVDPNIITPNAIIKDTLGLDSLDFVDLVVLIERNFGFKMAGEDFINLKSFEDFYQYVFERLQQSVDIWFKISWQKGGVGNHKPERQVFLFFYGGFNIFPLFFPIFCFIR